MCTVSLDDVKGLSGHEQKTEEEFGWLSVKHYSEKMRDAEVQKC
jgi:hypothetical protein